jgi:DNA invertase Pin-like site-specific DNA recombinase
MTAETLSPAVQREKIDGYAGLYDHTVVGWPEDLDVSGAVSIWGRDLAPWLTNAHQIAMWDLIIVAKLDRLTRSIIDFGKFIEWCNEHGKTIVSVSESLDFSTAAGRLFAGILVMFAQFERERMSERRRDRAQADKARGWWGGGWTPYGFEAVKVENHYELVVNEAEKAVVERMAEDIKNGMSATQLADNMEAEGIPTRRGGKWASTTIYDILRNPDTVLDDTTWTNLQPIIGAALRPKNVRYDAAMLSMVVTCANCGHKMCLQRTRRGTDVWAYYRCYRKPKCGAKMIPQAPMEAAVNDAMTDLSGYGGAERVERRAIPGNNRQALIDEAARSIAALSEKWVAKKLTRDEYSRQIDMLLDEQELAEAMPIVPDSYEPIGTGQLIADWWRSLTDQGKRHWLISQEWKIHAKTYGGDPIVTIEPSHGLTADMEALDIDRRYYSALEKIWPQGVDPRSVGAPPHTIPGISGIAGALPAAIDPPYEAPED